MAGVGRGTTPINTFAVDVDLRDAVVVWLDYKQSKIVIHKEKEDMEIDEDEVRVHLTQEETLGLKDSMMVRMQFRARYADGNAIKSNVITATVEEILKDGII